MIKSKIIKNKMKIIILSIGVICCMKSSNSIAVNAESLNDNIPVTAFGANGTDKLDDTIGIQAALDEARNISSSENIVTISIPRGTYYISKPLYISSYTCLKSQPDTKIIRNHTNGGMIVNKDAGTRYECGGYNANCNITIDGGIWDGNKNKRAYSTMKFIHAENINIKNATIINNYQGHLIEFAGIKNSAITNSTLKTFKGSTEVAKEAIQLDIVHNKGMVPGGFPYDDTACENIIIKNNVIEDYQRGIGSHVSVKNVYSNNIEISQNTFRNIKDEAINAFNYKNIRINNNTFINTGLAIEYRTESEEEKDFLDPLLDKVYKGETDYGISISNNDIANWNEVAEPFGDGIKILGTNNRPITNAVISKNKIVCDNNAISYSYVSKSEISENEIKKSKYSIYLREAADNEINDNIGSGALVDGIYLSKNSNNCSISGNNIDNSQRNGITLYESDNITIENNKLKENQNDGIFASNIADTCIINDNEISNNKNAGIITYFTDKAEIKNNVLNKNSIIVSDQSNECLIEDNLIKSSNKNGVSLINSESAYICNNVIEGSKLDGIAVSSSSEAGIITNNQVIKSNKNGITVDESNNISLIKNSINSTKLKEILLSNSSNCNVNGLAKPYIRKITTNTTKVVGKAKKDLKMQMIINGKIYKVKVDSKGNFKSSTIRRQRENSIVKFVVTDKASNKFNLSTKVVYEKTRNIKH